MYFIAYIFLHFVSLVILQATCGFLCFHEKGPANLSKSDLYSKMSNVQNNVVH